MRTVAQPVQPGAPSAKRPRSITAVAATRTAAPQSPNRSQAAAIIGVNAVSTTYTHRNHSGLSTSSTIVRMVPAENPAHHSAAVTGTQTRPRTGNGRANRVRRRRISEAHASPGRRALAAE